MHWRVRREDLGGHSHLTIFVGKAREHTHANCGKLVMTFGEADDFISMLQAEPSLDQKYFARDEG